MIGKLDTSATIAVSPIEDVIQLKANLIRENGLLVYYGPVPSDLDILQLIEGDREARMQAVEFTEVDALNAAVELLAKIDEGTRQLRNSECTVYNDESLKEHFDDVKARGQARYDEQ